MECLLSTATLEIASAPDMDLTSCVEHFLGGKMTATQVLAASNPDLLEDVYIQPHQARQLRRTADRCLKWARDPDRPAIANTTFDEAAAIQLYTQQTCLYPRLNSALRDKSDPENLKPVFPYLKLLLTGLNKLPLVRAKVYRGVCLDLHKQYNQLQGRVFTWWAFSSTTMSAKLMQSKLFLGEKGDRTLFSIDAIGVDIAAFSAFPDEQELLLLPGTSLKVQPGVEIEPNYWSFEAAVCHTVVCTERQEAHEEGTEEGKEEHGDTGTKLEYCSKESTDKKQLNSYSSIYDSMKKAVAHVEEKRVYNKQKSDGAKFRQQLTAGKDPHIVPALVRAGISKLGLSLGAKRLKVRMKPDSLLRQEGVRDGLYLYAVERGDGRFADLRNHSPKQVVDVLHSWVHHDRILFFSEHKYRANRSQLQDEAAVKVELSRVSKSRFQQTDLAHPGWEVYL